MALRCKDILELPSLQKLKLVGGRDGLDGIVRWVHVADVPHVTDWVQGGELLFITGIGVQKGVDSLVQLVHAIHGKRLAGLVINIGPYIHEIPAGLGSLADNLGFPIFELPWDVKLVEVTADICKLIIMNQIEEKSLWDLTENILFGPVKNPEILINRAIYYGYHLNKHNQVAIVDIDNFTGYLKKVHIKDEKRVLELKMNFQQAVLSAVAKSGKKILCIPRSDSVILLLTEAIEGDLVKISEDILRTVSEKLLGMTASIGIGSCYVQLTDIEKSLHEAKQAVRVAKWTNDGNQSIEYRDIGFYRLLFRIEDRQELLVYYTETLRALLDYDKEHKSDLLPTLEVYFTENCNLIKTTEKLYVHRNTLKYRLEKIENLTGRSLSDHKQRCNFQLALAIGKILDLLK